LDRLAIEETMKNTIHNIVAALSAALFVFIMHANAPVTLGAGIFVLALRLGWQFLISKLDPSDAMLDRKLAQSEVLDANELSPGHEYWLRLYVGGIPRLYWLFVPPAYDPSKRSRLVIAADGVTILCRRGNMAIVNRWQEAASRKGFLLAVLVPERARYGGIVSGWNYPAGYLRFSRKRNNDVRYVNRLADELAEKLSPSDILLGGFSAASDLLIEVVRNAHDPRIFKGVISICGTVLRRKNLPAGVGYLGINGIADTTLPWEGGAGSLKVKVLSWLGNRSVKRSRPEDQIRLFAAANGYGEEPRVRRTYLFHRVDQYNPSLHTACVQVVIGHPYGGHAMPSRETGSGADSRFKSHGDPIPPEHFELFDLVEEVFPTRR
jgi:poly(3-hydroxybutyrate) depolymerase